jgi:hypothetical protein
MKSNAFKDSKHAFSLPREGHQRLAGGENHRNRCKKSIRAPAGALEIVRHAIDPRLF